MNETSGEIIDTVEIIDNKFQVKLDVKKPFVLYMQTERLKSGNYFLINVIAEPGIIYCDMETDLISGTPTNDKYYAFVKERQQMESVIQALYSQMDESVNMPQNEQDKFEQQIEERINDIFKLTEQTFEKNKENCIGALALNYLVQLDTKDFEQLQKMYQSAAPIVRENKRLAENMSSLEKKSATSEGKKYTDLDLKDFKTGKDVKLSDYINGKVALIDFWASWCRPCRAEIPNIAEIYKQYGGDNFVVISLNVWDKPDAQKKAITDLKMDWIQLTDETKNATDTYGVDGIPQILLIDKDGTIIARDLRGEDIENAVKKALKK